MLEQPKNEISVFFYGQGSFALPDSFSMFFFQTSSEGLQVLPSSEKPRLLSQQISELCDLEFMTQNTKKSESFMRSPLIL